jgi:hypothetical protein
VFHPLPPPEDRDILELTGILHRRIVRLLQRLGCLPREGDDHDVAPDETGQEAPLLARISAASVQGCSAASGKRDQKIGKRSMRKPGHRARSDFTPGALCSAVDGFTLHARTVIAGDDRDALERLCRYTARPPIASERLSLAEDGRVVYRLHHPWRDGTTAIAFEPLTFLERLAAALVQTPPPTHAPHLLSRRPRPCSRLARPHRARNASRSSRNLGSSKIRP